MSTPLLRNYSDWSTRWILQIVSNLQRKDTWLNNIKRKVFLAQWLTENFPLWSESSVSIMSVAVRKDENCNTISIFCCLEVLSWFDTTTFHLFFFKRQIRFKCNRTWNFENSFNEIIVNTNEKTIFSKTSH